RAYDFTGLANPRLPVSADGKLRWVIPISVWYCFWRVEEFTSVVNNILHVKGDQNTPVAHSTCRERRQMGQMRSSKNDFGELSGHECAQG
ncbi:Hypothetical protein CINCED_3A025851, partial [Cinara cedri]